MERDRIFIVKCLNEILIPRNSSLSIVSIECALRGNERARKIVVDGIDPRGGRGSIILRCWKSIDDKIGITLAVDVKFIAQLNIFHCNTYRVCVSEHRKLILQC